MIFNRERLEELEEKWDKATEEGSDYQMSNTAQSIIPELLDAAYKYLDLKEKKDNPPLPSVKNYSIRELRTLIRDNDKDSMALLTMTRNELENKAIKLGLCDR